MSRAVVTVLATVVVALFASACATPQAGAPADAYRAPATRTGSNIPSGREEASATRSPSAAEQQRIDETVLPRPARGGGGGG